MVDGVRAEQVFDDAGVNLYCAVLAGNAGDLCRKAGDRQGRSPGRSDCETAKR